MFHVRCFGVSRPLSVATLSNTHHSPSPSLSKTCNFSSPLQQIQDIPKILKHKKDAIAFERVGRNVKYIQELPASVNDRLSADYRDEMNHLLKHLLKLDPQERMNFDELFMFVDDLVFVKNEVMNLLQGTSGKTIPQ